MKFQVKNPTKMISTFPVSVKMCAKVIPTKGKHILKPLGRYITEVKKENWDLVGASRYADLNHWRTAPSCSFQGPTTRCANKIPLKKQLHMKELKALKQVQEKIGGILLAHWDNQGQRSNFSSLLGFCSSETPCARVRQQLKW